MKIDFKEYFQQSYQGRNSFLEHVIYPIFGEENFVDLYDQSVLELYPELQGMAESTGIASILSVGEIQVDFNPINIFDITVSNHVLMTRNRVGIQQIIRRIMPTFSSAFMIFHYDDVDNWDWRFTFCSKARNDEQTDKKRYTFMLGPNQSCRTVAENFQKLLDKEGEIELKDIEEAFDVEALSKEFFRKYKWHYERFVEYITGKHYDTVKGKCVEKVLHDPHPQMYKAFGCNDKKVRDYIKKMMGRIVFLHFMQKKGWMGVPENKSWGDGDNQFMLHLFECASELQKADFLDAVLEPLFADALDTDRTKDNDLFDTKVALPQGSKVKIPYLNGGLFERDELDEIDTQFPGAYFEDLLTFLYQYNFTIDENDPDDAQVGVDPEMLGRIFENLLEDNKDKGTYYTPKEIVRYMCQESLIAYLQTNEDEETVKEQIAHFVKTYDVEKLGGASSDLAVAIDQRLKDVKVCDPAIGSGAFPMGLLKELFLCRGAIENFENAADIKRHIIQQNIYGVDIERGAVDIARLRFWLSMVVDEEAPHTLPNLDFKIMQGNSLLESYKGVDLSQMMSEVKRGTTVKRKGKYRVKEVEVKSELSLIFDEKDIQKNIQDLMKKYYDIADHAEREEHRNRINAYIKDYIKKCGPAIADEVDKLEIPNDQFFLWHTYFADVFENGGFDIVIGNPPYVQLNSEEKKQYGNYSIIEGHVDLYELFIQQGNNLLRDFGVLCYIIPNTILTNLYSRKLRINLVKEYGLCEITNFGMNAFPGQVVHTCILRMQKHKISQEIGIKKSVDTYNDVAKSFDYYLSIGDIEGTENYTFDISLNDVERALFAKLNKYLTLGDLCYIRQCIKTGNDKEYVSKSNVPMPLPWKKTLKGKGMERYLIRENDVYLKYGDWLARNWKNKDFYERPKIAIREAGKQITACLDEENRYFLSSLYSLYLKEEYDLVDLKYLLGILNSKMATYFVTKIAFDLTQGAFTKVRTNQLARLPIPQSSNREGISDLADEVMKKKRSDSQADTSALENRIDFLVYHLYDLTYDEVLVVDQNPPFSREEYEAYQVE